MATPDLIEGLPERLSYLEPVLRKYTLPRPDRLIEDAWERADRLDTAGMQELAHAYREIVRRDDLHALSAWAKDDEDRFDRQWKEWLKLNYERESRGLTWLPDAESPVRERGLQLFYVFDRLAKKGLPPFNTREVVYSPPPVVLDWSKLPEDLRYVREPAMKYGKLWAQEHRDRFARRKTPQEHQELKALAERLRPTGDWERLCEWWSNSSMVDRPEADLVHWMLAVVNDIVPEPSADSPVSGSGLDWDKVPFDFKYLQHFAEEFGRFATPSERAELVRGLRHEGEGEGSRYDELKNLAMLSDRRDRRRLRQWLQRFRPEEHPEAKLMASLLALLEEHFSEWFLD